MTGSTEVHIKPRRTTGARRRVLSAVVAVLACAGAQTALAAGPAVTLVPNVVRSAGTGAGFYNGDFGSPNFVALNLPSYIAFDSTGSMYLSDTRNNCVRRVDGATGQISTIAGLISSSGSDTCNIGLNATPTAAQGLYQPQGIAVDSFDNLYISDSGHNCVRMLPARTSSTALAQTVAGTCTANNPTSTTTTGSKTPRPVALAIDRTNALFISLSDAPDSINQVLRHLSGAAATDLCIIAGTPAANVGTLCSGITNNVALNAASGLVLGPIGGLYISDTGNNCIRRNFAGATSTAVGTCANDSTTSGTASISSPTGLVFTSLGELYISASGTNQLLLFNPGSKALMRIAGSPSGAAGAYDQSQNGAGSQSVPLHTPTGLAIDPDGNVVLADSENHVLRRFELSTNFPSAPLGNATNSQLLTFTINNPTVNLTITPGPDYVLNTSNCGGTLSGAAAGNLSTFCSVTVSFRPTLPGKRYSSLQLHDSVTNGNTFVGLEGIGLGSQPVFIPGQVNTFAPNLGVAKSVVTDSSGSVFVLHDNFVTAYNAAGTTSSTAVAAGAGGLVAPSALANDAAGNLYVADSTTGKVVQFSSNGTVAPDYVTGLTSPTALALDSFGNLYIAEGGAAHDVVKVLVGGQKVVLAGAGSDTNANNVLATTAKFQSPSGVTVSLAGDVHISDAGARRVYTIDVGGTIHVLAGNGTATTTAAGTALGTALLQPSGLDVDSAGDVYIADPPANKVYVVYASTQQTANIGVLLGTGTAGNTGDGGYATSATTSGPADIATASSGATFVVDAGNKSVRVVTFPVQTLDFGTVAVGGTVVKKQSLWNRGNTEFLRTVDPAISNAPVYANYSQLTTCGQSISVGAVCDFGFSFTPPGTGFQSGAAILNDTAYNTPQVVNFKGTTGAAAITGFTAPDETEVYGQTYTGTSNLQTNGGAGPTGTITFSVGNTLLCTITPPLTGTRSCVKNPSSGLTPGTYTVDVNYSGDAIYPPQHITATLNVTKAPVSVVVDNKNKLFGDPNPPLTGTVTGVAAGDNFTVVYSTPATQTSAPGTYPINAVITFAPPTLAAFYDVTIIPGVLNINAAPVLTLASSANPSGPQQSVTFTATLTPSMSPGTIAFFDGTNLLCPAVAVTSGTATCTTNTLGLGIHAIRAVYTPSNAFFQPATQTLNQIVSIPTGSFTIAIAPASQYIIGPGSMTFPVTVTSLGGFAGPISLSCTGLPADATCVLANMTLTLTAGGTLTTTLTTTTSDKDAKIRTPALPWTKDVQMAPVYAATMLPMGLSGFGILLAGIRRRKSLKRLMLVIFIACGAATVAGCGCPVDSLKTYPVTVVASSVNGGPPNATATALLTVAKKGE